MLLFFVSSLVFVWQFALQRHYKKYAFCRAKVVIFGVIGNKVPRVFRKYKAK
jgi:lipoprotein signal peptidase